MVKPRLLIIKRIFICYDDEAHAAHSSGNGNHVDIRKDIMNIATTGATSSHERNENNCHLSLKGANIRGQGSPETTLVFIVENPVQNLPNVAEGPGKDDKSPDNTEIIGAASSTVRDHSCSQAVDPPITTPDVDVITKPGGTSVSDRSMTVDYDNFYLQQNSRIDEVCRP
ncbi:hypothetical protein F0562_012224 [Nyssa sinensis]|uniref:Uncharacterized protein n=1 Tax=Nyssa sinensis TaxID=561372 RepID=A0A5J4ZWR6_9ASTE|nr:hypothetical protein F0562_012224 [Nyssa sinensis]